MNKLKIRITKFDTQSPKEKGRKRWFHDIEETVFLHEMDEERFFSLLNAIGKVDEYGKDVKEDSRKDPWTGGPAVLPGPKSD